MPQSSSRIFSQPPLLLDLMPIITHSSISTLFQLLESTYLLSVYRFAQAGHFLQAEFTISGLEWLASYINCNVSQGHSSTRGSAFCSLHGSVDSNAWMHHILLTHLFVDRHLDHTAFPQFSHEIGMLFSWLYI